jgi:ParB family chromosome partitioning protein
MPKLEGAGITRKIGIDQIIDTGNVRELYSDIEELAESIKKNGQLQAVIVKAAGESPEGIPQYELIAGFRRLRAFKYLVEHEKEGFTSIDAAIVTGDKLTIQLVENIQRADLNAPEKERGIFLMTENGLSQKQVAEKLSKTEEFISRNISAYKVRLTLEKAGINTVEISTSILNEIQTVKSKDLPEVMRQIIEAGGSSRDARNIAKQYREKAKPPRLEPIAAPAEESPAQPEPEESGSVDIDPLATVETGTVDVGDFQEPEKTTEAAAPEKEKQKPAPEKRKPIERETIEPDHATVDVNKILLGIYDYVSGMQKKLDKAEPPFDIEYGKFQIKIEAADDIIAIIHKAIE